MRGEPSRKELIVALVAALSWLAVVLIALVCSAAAYGQSTGSAVCRVHNRLGGFANVGSGTLVDKTADGREGLILTCWPWFREGTGQVVVQCDAGKRGWIDGVGGCANVGGVCIGCTMPGFPDKFMPFMDEPHGAKLSTAAISIYGRTVHALRQFIKASQNKEPEWRGPDQTQPSGPTE